MRINSIVAAAVLMIFLAASSRSAAAGSACSPFRVGDLDTTVSEEPEARAAPVLRVTDRHTKKDPLEISFDQGANLWVLNPLTLDWRPILQDTVYMNAQVFTDRERTGLHARIEWDLPSPSEIDLGLYDQYGRNRYWSGAFNNVVLDTVGHQVFGPYSGGDGYEEIRGWSSTRCEGFTFEIWSVETPGEHISMKLWLGKVDDDLFQ